jgi:peptidoglycan/xylan/chitin deacetylase (PgdA/CDA1 family)
VAALIVGLQWTQGSAMMLGQPIKRSSPINSVELEQKKIALSFDTNSSSDNIDQILSILQDSQIPSTFFVYGEWVKKNPEDAQKLVQDDNVEIGSLGNSQQDFTKLNSSQVQNQLDESNQIISQAAEESTKLFRAPMGKFNKNVLDIAGNLGFMAIGFDTSCLAQDSDIQKIAAKILQTVQNGSIVLLNEFDTNINRVLPLIIKGLQNQGFEFEKIGEMVLSQDYFVDNAGRQHKK